MAKKSAQAKQPAANATMRQPTQPPQPMEPEPPPPLRKLRPVKVRALEMGYYDHARRRPGDVFILADPSHFSRKWMEIVDDKTPERTTGAGQALAQEHDRLRGERAPGKDDEPSI